MSQLHLRNCLTSYLIKWVYLRIVIAIRSIISLCTHTAIAALSSTYTQYIMTSSAIVCELLYTAVCDYDVPPEKTTIASVWGTWRLASIHGAFFFVACILISATVKLHNQLFPYYQRRQLCCICYFTKTVRKMHFRHFSDTTHTQTKQDAVASRMLLLDRWME